MKEENGHLGKNSKLTRQPFAPRLKEVPRDRECVLREDQQCDAQ